MAIFDIGTWINWLPLWALFLLTLAICIGAVEAGSRLAQLALMHKNEQEPEAPLGTLVAAMLGLLGFFLAFTFGLTASRFDARRQLVLEEANALGTTYLRAGVMPQAQRQEIRQLLRKYTDLRLSTTTQNAQEVLSQSQEIHDKLWAQVELLAREQTDSELRALFVASLNDLIDLHQSRVTVGMQYRIASSIWFGVYLLAVLSLLAFGYQIGMSGVRRLRGSPILAAAFSLVILLIADVDRPGEGLVRVSQQPIVDVRSTMKDEAP